MVIPAFASGLLRRMLPADASLFFRLPDLSGFDSLLSGERDPDHSVDDALLAQIAVRDPSVLAALLHEIDRRLSDDIPEGAETTARLEGLRDLLRRLGSEVPPQIAPEGPDPFPAGRVLSVLAKDVDLRAVPAPEAANAELVDRVLRASALVRARGISRLRLTLETPGLGEIRLDLTLRGSVVCATFRADAPGAAELLHARLSELKSALEKRGLQVGELTVLAVETGIPLLPPAPSASASGHLDLKA